MSHLEAISNGLGGQSMYLLWLAGQGRIPAAVSITADTGSENDCLWNSGERTTSREYFEQVVKPLADKWGIDARFVRAVDKRGTPMPAIHDYARSFIQLGNGRKQMIPLFGVVGERGSRLSQTCTGRFKVTAINQEARRLGAKTMRTHQGIHYGEAARRVKGKYIGVIDGLDTYRTTRRNKKTKKEVEIRWLSHSYPLVDLRMDREAVRAELERLNIPYLVSSECDMCPHKDAPRWLRTAPEKIKEIAEWEAEYKGEFYFTDQRIPLKDAIAKMKRELDMNPTLFSGVEPDFGCGNSYCGI